MNSNLRDCVERSVDRDGFVLFVRELIRDFQENKDEWESHDIPSYLEALAAWAEDMDGMYSNRGEPVPQGVSWRVFAQILLSASIYE